MKHRMLRMKEWRGLTRYGLAALLLSLAACASIDPVTGKRVFNLYSLDQDVQMGRTFLQQNTKAMRDAQVRINDDTRRVAQLNEIISRLSAVSDLPELPYEVTLYHTNIVNAAAAPGGSMMVFEGLYANEKDRLVMPDDEDELAAVMAHEIAHVTCRHVTERLSQVTTVSTLAQLGAAVASQQNEKEIAYAFQGLFAVYAGLYIPRYTRKSESEADRIGLLYMARAGYDPRAAPRIWKRAAERKEGHGASIFATHPANEKRFRDLEALLPFAMEEYKKTTGTYPKGYQPGVGSPVDGNFDWRLPR